MRVDERSQGDRPGFFVRRRRRRMLTLAVLVAGAGILATTIAPSATSALQAGRVLPSGSATVDYSCVGADQATNDLLTAVGLNPISLATTITSAAVEPAPSPAEDFDLPLTWEITLDPNFVGFMINVGVTGLAVSNSQYPLAATTGATGTAVGIEAVGGAVPLGDGSVPVGYTQGPFTGTFNRTAAIDAPIVFTPGTVTTTFTTSTGVALPLTCAPGTGAITVSDETLTLPTTTTTGGPTSTTSSTVVPNPTPNTFTTQVVVVGSPPPWPASVTGVYNCNGPLGTGPGEIQASGPFDSPATVGALCTSSLSAWPGTPAGTVITHACSTTGDAVCMTGNTRVQFGDFGTGKITATVTVPSADPGVWFESNSVAAPVTATRFRWGDGAGQVLACDTDGDGRDGPVIFRNGIWFVSTAETPSTRSYLAAAFAYGTAGDIAVCGDWNGDGKDGIGVYRPSEGGRWRLRNAASAGATSVSFYYGIAGDKPVVGDWDTDGRDEPGVLRSGNWYIGNLSGSTMTTVRTFTYGRAGDVPLSGDWDGNGIDGIGVRRASTQRFYLRNSPTVGVSNYSAMWGRSSDLPITGNWNADAKDSVGLVRSQPTI